jgi:hypothetical protein
LERIKHLGLSVRSGQPGYKVVFKTSSMLGAGTAARVFFELVGEQGSSGIAYVGRGEGGGGFDRGGISSLLFPRLPHIGSLRQLRVGTDGSGLFAPWHLRRVEVVHVASGDRWVFDAHAWIDQRCDYQRILPVSQFDPGREGAGSRACDAAGREGGCTRNMLCGGCCTRP